MRNGVKPPAVLLGPFVLLALLAACGPSIAGPSEVGTMTEDGVQVRLRWTAGPESAGPEAAARLAVTFTPLQAGFHLYSVDLPANGVQGVGRPTKVELGGALSVIGAVAVDRRLTALRVTGLDAPVWVYPDGPVTLTLPVRFTPGSRPPLAWVSYAACSRSSCLPPVTHRQVGLELH